MHTASDELIRTIASLSGALTRIRNKYGNAAQMLEDPRWDEGKTGVAISLLAVSKRKFPTFIGR